ncbi:MAG TPA: ABC transporter ATP-binding protein [Beutenbergiaceae bacterium]|nr:ABC transporter ATP-binding protein [Beutenbergiaceae bacterium]
MPSIELQNITKNYGGGTPNAVDDLNLTIEDGDFMCLLGPSGCGKTTTLRMICGLENPTRGTIRIGDRVVDSVEDGIFVPPEHRRLGLVFQSYALWPHLTVYDNVDFGLKLKKIPQEERRQRVGETMEKLGISAYAKRYPSELSGGQQQRVALARMLAINPEILLLDEPLSNLDARLRLEMRTELKRIHEEFNTTVVFVTHDQWEAMTLATRIAVLNEGELQQVDTPVNIYENPSNQYIAEFVGNPPINLLEAPSLTSAEIDSQITQRLSGLGGDQAAATVGIRPEDITVSYSPNEGRSDALTVNCRIDAVLPTGGNWIIELSTKYGKLFAVAQNINGLKPDTDAYASVRLDNLKMFDSSGVNLSALAAV